MERPQAPASRLPSESVASLGPLILQTREKLFPDGIYFLIDFSKWLFSSQPHSHASLSFALTFMKLWIFAGRWAYLTLSFVCFDTPAKTLDSPAFQSQFFLMPENSH